MANEKQNLEVNPEDLKGQINIPNVEPELETAVIQFRRRFKLSKAEAARMLIRDGLLNLGKKDKLVLHAGR